MNVTWIVVGLAGWGLALVFVLLLMRMAGQQDRAARHGERKLDPFSDVPITEVETRTFTTAHRGGTAGDRVPRADGAPPVATCTGASPPDRPPSP